MNELSHQAQESRKEYYRRWRAANQDKVKEKNRRYWERRAVKEKAAAKAAEKEALHDAENENH